MKKYFQITFFLGIFGLLVFIRQVKGNDEHRVVGSVNFQPLPTALPNAMQTPTTAKTSSGIQNQQVVSTPTPTTPPQTGMYKNGIYNGSVQDAYYGNVQVQVSISQGKITSVNFLQYPNDNPTSQYVNSQAMPLLQQETLQAQSAQVDIISGASATSQAFQASLADALASAH